MTLVTVPTSNQTVSVQIFDTTFRIINGRPQAFMSPAIKGFDRMNALAFSFLITHRNENGKARKFLFDLGAPKNWKDELPPDVANNVKKWERAGIMIEVRHYLSEIIMENGVDLDSVEGVIWRYRADYAVCSHPHWDHIGQPSRFAPSSTLIFGPGITSAFGPGYPENKDAPFRSEAVANRDIHELNFDESSTLSIGSMRAIDFFGDGSFYFLDAPGHAVGHINALARTSTNPDTFIYMGADSYHHPAALRPSEGVPLPHSVSIPNLNPYPCPGELFESLHPCAHLGNANRTAFVKIGEKSPAIDLAAARDTLRKIQAFDADDNILLIAAHDWSLKNVIDFYPQSANDWKRKGWKEKGRWRFLIDFQRAIDLAVRSRI